MKIFDAQGVSLLDIEVDDTSHRYRAIMGDHKLVLRLSLAEHCEIPLGAYCLFQGTRYTLMRPEDIKKNNSRNYDYTVEFQSDEYKARIWKFRNTTDGRLKFPLTATPKEHLQMMVDNLNRREEGWSVGSCIEGPEVLINYDHDYCLDALAKMASELKTEYIFEGKRVSLGKVEAFKDSPLPLSYGKGNGFVSGVGRSNSDDNPPAEILYVQGGTTNIDRSKYPPLEEETVRASSGGCLLLPRLGTLSYDGEHFEREVGFNEATARTYVADDLGLSLQNTNRARAAVTEASVDLSHIYPNRVGEVSAVLLIPKQDGDLYDIIDSAIPSALDFEQCIIGDNKLTVKFQSGMLAGKEFEANYVHNAVGDKAGRRFELVPQEIDGIMMPGSCFIPHEGDKYVVLNCSLPAAYINAQTNDPNGPKEGAEWELFRAAVKHLYEAEEQHFTFSGTLDGLWAKKDWVNIGGKLKLGAFVLFSDTAFAPEGVKVRIVGIKDYVNNPHSPEIELSNSSVSSSVGTTLRELAAEEVTNQENYAAAIRFTKRRWRDAKETMAMLEQAMLENFSESINPIAIKTMQMLVGDEALQFRFVIYPPEPKRPLPTEVPFDFQWDSAAQQLRSNPCFIQHMTLGIDSLSPNHSPYEYKYWSLAGFTSARLSDPAKKYYVYAKVLKQGNTGEFRLETEAKRMDGGTHYWLLVGVLNSEQDGDRSFVPLYGFTEVLPGRVTTNRIVSSDGNSYFDMVNSAMKLGDKLHYSNGQLTFKGVLVQSPEGITAPIGCFRGDYDPAATYFEGDEVTYSPGENLPQSAYRCISAPIDTGISGIAPTDTSRWHLTAAGVEGKAGTSIRVKGTFSNRYASRAAYDVKLSLGGYDLIDHDETLNADCVVAHYTPPVATAGFYTYTPAEEGDAWVKKSDGHLYIAGGSQGWMDAGPFKGQDGANGDYTQYRFRTNGSTSTPPALSNTSLNPTGWSTSMPTIGLGQYLWMTQAVISGDGKSLKSNWSTPVRINGQDGKDGASPAMAFQGMYDSSKTYYGTKHRLDCVKYGDAYFIARIDAGEFSNVPPTDTSKWNPFGASFESVATNLLLAEYAQIDNLGVSNLQTAAEGKRIDIKKERNSMIVYGDTDSDTIEIAGDVLDNSDLFSNASVSLTTPAYSRKAEWNMDSPQGVVTNRIDKLFTLDHPSTLHGQIELSLELVNDGAIIEAFYGEYQVLLDGERLALVSINKVGKETVTVDINRPITAGAHTLTYYRYDNANIEFRSGNSLVTLNRVVNVNLKASAKIRKSVYFANGNAIGCSPTQFSQTTMNNNGLLTHHVEAGDAGIKLYGNKLRLKIGGQWYTLGVNTSTNQLTLTKQ